MGVFLKGKPNRPKVKKWLNQATDKASHNIYFTTHILQKVNTRPHSKLILSHILREQLCVAKSAPIWYAGSMRKLLQQAVAQIDELPEDQQDAVAINLMNLLNHAIAVEDDYKLIEDFRDHPSDR